MEIKPKGKTVSVVLGTYNRLGFLKATIRGIRKEIVNINAEIIVIDGGSDDGTIEWLASQRDIISLIQHNHNEWNGKTVERKSWGYFMNLGFKIAKGKYICMLSDDCLVVPGAVRLGIDLFEKELKSRKKIGAVAFYWRNWPECRKYFVGFTLGNNMFVNYGLYLKKAIEDIGYIDEEHYFFYYADGDVCLRLLQKGYRCIDSKNSFVEHYRHANVWARRKNNIRERQDWKSYINRWTKIYYDPSINNTGKPIEKMHIDQFNTVRGFPLATFLKGKLCIYFARFTR